MFGETVNLFGSVDQTGSVEIKQLGKDSFEFSQPFLIKHALPLLRSEQDTMNNKLTPFGKPLLVKDVNSVPHTHSWNCRGLCGLTDHIHGAAML